MPAHKFSYDTLCTPDDPPERGTREWYKYKRARREGRLQGLGRAGKFREIDKHKPIPIERVLSDSMPRYTDSEYWFYVWNVGVVRCVYCSCRLNRDNRTQDHVIPKARGGTFLGRENLMPCCNRCNGLKADSSLLDFLLSGGMKTDDVPG